MTQEVIRLLLDTLGEDKVFFGESVKERYHHIWKMDEPLQALAVVVVKNVEDVSFVLRICNETKTSVVVHGGLTNLVGSTETAGNEVVITLEKLNEIIEVDQSSRTITAESGVILEDLQMAAKNADLLFPLNFGAKGSAQIGGVISTNAGGLRVFRYGMTRALVLGLEAVLADGTIISSMKKIIKDNNCTWFLPKISKLDARKKWIISSVSPKGEVVIDDGATKALSNGKSLLAAGIIKVSGKFKKGDHIKILDKKNSECARGLSSFSSDEILRIMGCHSREIEKILGYVSKSEVIHKDDMVEI